MTTNAFLKPSIILEPGKYVVAVSGGVDSVVLLNLLSELKNTSHDGSKYKYVVAHFDHGIRTDSNLDRILVGQLAKDYKLPFVFTEGHLGAGASEALARDARYEFLSGVQKASKAQAIITAHHQDDVLETAIINIIRGTGRKGITSLNDHRHLRRPMLHISKEQIRNYASEQGLVWREDSTNQDMGIMRNYIRGVILPKLGPKGRQELLNHIGHLKVVNKAIDNDLLVYLHVQPSLDTLDRASFTMLPHKVALEVMASWLRNHQVTTFNSKLLERLVIKCKTLPSGKQTDVDADHRLLVGNDTLALVCFER